MDEILTGDHYWARKVLSWLLFSFRPLKCAEIAVALAVDADSGSLASMMDNISQNIEADLQRVFGPLIDTESGEVRLVHQSFREFLLGKRRNNAMKWYGFETPAHEHANHVQACLTYLLLVQPSGDKRSDDHYIQYIQDKPRGAGEAREAHCSLLTYAAGFWPAHYSEAVGDPTSVEQLRAAVLGFFGSGQSVRMWCILRRFSENHTTKLKKCECSSLEHASELGFLDVVQVCLHNAKAEISNQVKGHALCLAAQNGWLQVVELILKFGVTNGADVADATNDTAGTTDDVSGTTDGDSNVINDIVNTTGNVATGAGMALRRAAARGYESVVHLLLSAVPRNLGSNGLSQGFEFSKMDLGTSLSWAACYGHKSICVRLIEAGADINSSYKCCPPPLYRAARNGHNAVVALFLERGAIVSDVSNIGPSELTPLHVASRNGHIQVVKQLLESQVDVNAHCEGLYTPLHQAAQSGHVSIVTMLLKAGAGVNVNTDHGYTPLHFASECGFLSVVKALLDPEYAGNTDPVAQNGDTPLSLATVQGHLEIVRFLAGRGADVSATNSEGVAPLHRAAQVGFDTVVQLLLELGADLEVVESNGMKPIHLAALHGHRRIVELLIEAGSSENAEIISIGATPLHVAAMSGHIPVVETLIAAGADLDAKMERDWVAMHHAYNNIEIMKRLVEGGANINATTDKLWTPLNLAANEGYEIEVKFLLDVGADAAISNDSGQPPLHTAAKWGYRGTVEVLLNPEIYPFGYEDSKSRLPLFYAAASSSVETIKALLDHSQDRGLKDNSGRVALDVALSRQARRLLLEHGQQIEDQQDAEESPTRNKECKFASFEGENYYSGIYCDNCRELVDGFFYREFLAPVLIASWILDLLDVSFLLQLDCCLCNEDNFDTCTKCYDKGKQCSDSDHVMKKRYIEDDMLSLGEYSEWVDRMEMPSLKSV